MKIGIFKGKKADYNQRILEILYEEGNPLTAWEIAKILQNKFKQTTNTKAAQQTTHDIYSVIQRKDGRLQELREKKYIIFEKGKWSLSFWKGRIAVFMKNPQLLDRLDIETYNRGIALMREKLRSPPNTTKKLPFGITLSVKGNEFRKDFERVLTLLTNDSSFIRLMVDEIQQIRRSIDLDQINDEALVALLINRKKVKKELKRLM